jgi:phytoene dehydrogenase-like protein
MGRLVEALTGRAREAGVELLCRAPALAIHPGTPRHAVTFAHDGQERAVEATRVLVNAGPQVFDRLLGRLHAETTGDEGSVCKVNMLLRRLPRLKAGHIDPRDGFAGTLHIDESYAQMQASYRQAMAGRLPERPPAEVYCHTLTDSSILGPSLRDDGYHTLTLFGLDVPYRVFAQDHDARKAEVLRRYLVALNGQLAEPIEDCLAQDAEGAPCIEIKTPQDLEREVGLNRGNIFHAGLSWFFAGSDEQAGTWGVETPFERIYRCGSSAQRGGAVSGIPGRNAAQSIFEELRRTRLPGSR